VSKFKARPELRALPDPEAVAAFAAAAEHRTTVTALVPPAPQATAPAPAPVEADTARIVAVAPGDAPVTSTRRARRTSDESPWEKHDRDARPLSGINVRLNDYEHELLKYLAAADDRSIQQTIKRLLVPAAEAAARKIRRGE